ncbi:MAG: SAM-dependent methyltransferase [Bacteroidota bacterium]|nr:SAM-dependent methyltransferase [Bacteroidota bacterium]
MAENKLGSLFLIPVLLGDTEPLEVLPLSIKKRVDQIDHYIAENEKSARAFIKKVDPKKPQGDLVFYVLNKYTEQEDIFHFLDPCKEGHDMGLLSEAGVPGVADPGSEIVALAHRAGIRVVPLVGPSSILLALMASGMNGQEFCFNGYLPIEKAPRKRKIKSLETQARNGTSQIFMETPYRNMKLFEDLMTVCENESRLCIAADISLPDEFIRTRTISEWRNATPDLHKRPAIFILG